MHSKILVVKLERPSVHFKVEPDCIDGSTEYIEIDFNKILENCERVKRQMYEKYYAYSAKYMAYPKAFTLSPLDYFYFIHGIQIKEKILLKDKDDAPLFNGIPVLAISNGLIINHDELPYVAFDEDKI